MDGSSMVFMVVASSYSSAYQDVDLGIVVCWDTKDAEQDLWTNAMTETYGVTNGLVEK